MKSNRAAIDDYCRRELEQFRRRLDDLETGKLRLGNSSDDGLSWTDITSAEIASAKAKIAELNSLISER
jgi:hypothetical protein